MKARIISINKNENGIKRMHCVDKHFNNIDLNTESGEKALKQMLQIILEQADNGTLPEKSEWNIGNITFTITKTNLLSLI